jgi:hypothetical protein
VEDSQSGWRAPGEVDQVIRAGYTEAIHLARSRRVPIDTLWVTGTGDDFELHICDGPRHVSVVLFIPVDRDYGSHNATAKSWAFRAGEAPVQTSGKA